MKKNKESAIGRLELRKRAEERLKKNGVISDLPTCEAEWVRLLNELSMHQIELEMQNEELQDANNEIQNERQRYAELYNFAPVGYLTLAEDSTILEANHTINKVLSFERSYLKGVRFGQFIAQADLPVFNTMLKKVFQSRTMEHCEIMIGDIGHPEPASLRRTFRLDAIISDNLQQCHLTLIDFSDTREALQTVITKEAKYRCLFEASQEGILILDYKSRKIVDANPFIAHLIGFSIDEIIGKELCEIGVILEKELSRKANVELQTNKYICFSELPLQHKSGHIIDVEFLSYIYNAGDKKMIQCNIRDITHEKKVKEYEKAIIVSNQETIHALASMVEILDSYTAGHQKRVAELTVAIAKALHLSQSAIEGLQLSTILHDIGKFNIATEILIKPTELSDAEKDILRNHVEAGYDILKSIHFPWPIAQTVLQHHERLDGSGYPNGLKGDSVSEEARIIAVADTVEAMTSARPYRPAIGIDKALRHIQQQKGKLFDPLIVDTCVKLFHEKKFTFSTRPASETIISLGGGGIRRNFINHCKAPNRTYRNPRKQVA